MSVNVPSIPLRLDVNEQADPDNYTDEETFLDHLQRNPRLQPYEFWPLVADSMVIVQHVCSVAIFVCCFVGICQERISPVAVVSWGNIATILGWVLWDRWIAQEAAAGSALDGSIEADTGESASGTLNASSPQPESTDRANTTLSGLGLTIPIKKSESGGLKGVTTNDHTSSSSAPLPLISGHPTGAARFANYSYYPPYGATASSFSPRNQQRLATAKSACLIYGALLGLSPILKSLTKSISSDSIWALSCLLMCINVFLFDYGGAVGAKSVPS